MMDSDPADKPLKPSIRLTALAIVPKAKAVNTMEIRLKLSSQSRPQTPVSRTESPVSRQARAPEPTVHASRSPTLTFFVRSSMKPEAKAGSAASSSGAINNWAWAGRRAQAPIRPTTTGSPPMRGVAWV